MQRDGSWNFLINKSIFDFCKNLQRDCETFSNCENFSFQAEIHLLQKEFLNVMMQHLHYLCMRSCNGLLVFQNNCWFLAHVDKFHLSITKIQNVSNFTVASYLVSKGHCRLSRHFSRHYLVSTDEKMLLSHCKIFRSQWGHLQWLSTTYVCTDQVKWRGNAG